MTGRPNVQVIDKLRSYVLEGNMVRAVTTSSPLLVLSDMSFALYLSILLIYVTE